MLIEKIVIKDEFVIVKLDDREFKISINTYLNNNLLIGEQITEKEIKNLENQDFHNNCKSKLIMKISRKKLSKKECEIFLIDSGCSKEVANEIIGELEKNHLINDEELIEFIIDYCLLNKKGINIIKQKIVDRKINNIYQEAIDKYLDKEKYSFNIKFLIEKYKKMNKNKSRTLMKKYLIDKLIQNGYNTEEFLYLIDVCEVDENVILDKEIKKFFSKNEWNNENIAKITKKLLSKGFNYDIIKKAIRECELNETY